MQVETISNSSTNQSNDSNTINDKVEWNPAIETLIKEIGEKALAYQWLHNRSEKKYSRLNNYLALPTICISTIAGSASMASSQFGDFKISSLGIGALSIIVGIISTINSYFAFAKRAENHRISALNYSKLYLFVSIELSLPREKRMRPKDFIKVIREQVERLNEISPLVPDDIIAEFRKEFDGKYENVSRPEITNGLVAIRIYDETKTQPLIPSAPSVPPNSPKSQLEEKPISEPPQLSPIPIFPPRNSNPDNRMYYLP